MIDRGPFAAGMALLAGCFGRDVGVPVIKAYFVVLNARLTTAEFERAVSLAITEERYWPSPAVLLAKVGRDTETAALSALSALSSRLRLGGGFLHFAPTDYAQLDQPTKAGISAVGGLREICLCEPYRAAALERRFVAAYAAALDHAPVLTAGAEATALRAIDEAVR
jgi:hypothetical protein